MFYRDQLERQNDPDFRVRTYSEEEERVWLSRDADFATTDPAQMPTSAGGVPLGRLQMGFVLGAEEFKDNARKVRLRWQNTEFCMLIADPLDLWREKEAATFRRGRPQDSLHLEVLATFLRWETIHYADKIATNDLPFHQWISRLTEIRRRWNGLLSDQTLVTRLISLNVAEVTSYVTSK
jgi:hypothetical protein